MKRNILLLIGTLLIIFNNILLAQSSLIKENATLRINQYGDVVLNNPDRAASGRAFVTNNSQLFINYGNDFSKGTQIGTQAIFKDFGIEVGNRITSGNGEVNRITIIPYTHTGRWYISSRDQGNNAYLNFNYTDSRNLLTIHHKGNIGLGVANPQSKLDVNGTIRAKEVKVESTGWADFVFTPEYKLPTLSEIESHILEHGHLPDIPSENEVKERGVDVGEMQMKLLQKIEELTLYVIEQEKKYSKLKTELEVLKNK